MSKCQIDMSNVVRLHRSYVSSTPDHEWAVYRRSENVTKYFYYLAYLQTLLAR